MVNSAKLQTDNRLKLDLVRFDDSSVQLYENIQMNVHSSILFSKSFFII